MTVTTLQNGAWVSLTSKPHMSSFQNDIFSTNVNIYIIVFFCLEGNVFKIPKRHVC